MGKNVENGGILPLWSTYATKEEEWFIRLHYCLYFGNY